MHLYLFKYCIFFFCLAKLGASSNKIFAIFAYHIQAILILIYKENNIFIELFFYYKNRIIKFLHFKKD